MVWTAVWRRQDAKPRATNDRVHNHTHDVAVGVIAVR